MCLRSILSSLSLCACVVLAPAQPAPPAPDEDRLLFQRSVGSSAGEKIFLYEIPFDAYRLHPPRDVHPGPGPRASHALVYDERRQQTVLLDGYQPPFPDMPGVVWAWDGRQWKQVHPGNTP